MIRTYSVVFKCKSVIKGKPLHHCVHPVYLFIGPHNAMPGNWRDWVHYSRAVLDVFFFTSYIEEIAYSSEWIRWIFHNIHADNVYEVLWEGFLCHVSSLSPVIVKLYLYIQNFTRVDLLRVRPHHCQCYLAYGGWARSTRDSCLISEPFLTSGHQTFSRLLNPDSSIQISRAPAVCKGNLISFLFNGKINKTVA